MQVLILNKVHHLLLILLLNIFFQTSLSQEISSNYSYHNCGNIRIKSPFLNDHQDSFLSRMIVCQSDKLYFRTSVGSFPISSIDYENKLLTISHDSCSETSDFISPNNLSAGFPNPESPNSLILWNCDIRDSNVSIFPCNSSSSNSSYLSGGCFESYEGSVGSCSVIDDVGKLDEGFHPREMNCTHYSRVHRRLSDGKYKLGTRISFGVPSVNIPPVNIPPVPDVNLPPVPDVNLPPVHVPDVNLPPVHVPNPCDSCGDGCPIELQCTCHVKNCVNGVISAGVILKPRGNMFVDLVLLVLIILGMVYGK
ncbi:hypothetical protein OROGR_027661 [Orobanche gracilis]